MKAALPLPLLLLLVARFLGAQPADEGTLRTELYVDVFAARALSPNPTSPGSFAGGARLLSVPSGDDGRPALALVGAAARLRELQVRVAMQGGSSVDAHYAHGAAGSRAWRFVQEASATARLAPRLWVSAGIQPSHAAVEDWMPLANHSPTRSLLAEFAPWRHAGVRLGWDAVDRFGIRAGLISSWEFAGESPRVRGASYTADVRLGESTLVRGYGLRARRPDKRLRRLHGVGARGSVGPIAMLMQLEVGSQENSNAVGRAAHWWGYLLSARWHRGRAAINARFERFDDDEQILLRTGSSAAGANAPFRGYGESVGLDVRIAAGLVWRNEVRAFQNSGRSFPAAAGKPPALGTAFVLTALAARF